MGNWNNNKRNNNNFNNNQNKPKGSGYEFKMTDDGLPICWGWRKTRNGVQSMYARPYDKTQWHESKQGNEFANLFVTLKIDGMPIIKTSGLFNKTTKKLVIDEYSLLGTPNGGGQTKSGKYSKGSLIPLKSK